MNAIKRIINRLAWTLLGLLCTWAMASNAHGQARPYIGFVYPAGGQQGTTVQIRLGGQSLDNVNEAIVSGEGVSARVVELRRRLNPQEMQLLYEQLRELAGLPPKNKAAGGKAAKVAQQPAGKAVAKAAGKGGKGNKARRMIANIDLDSIEDPAKRALAEKIETRINEYTQRPACNSIATIAIVEVKIAPNAVPGPRQLILGTPHGASNPLPFYVSQIPEVSRKPMRTAEFEVLGKEELALRKRPPEEELDEIKTPCVVNGQIAPGEVNLYRFTAHQGQRLVISAVARTLVPFIADAVPGWFQPVMTLYDARGKEVAYDDDYRFSPDPVIFYEVPRDGQYTLRIADALYRGREDFVYRVSIGETPFVTSIFPLGCQAGRRPAAKMQGWNLESAKLTLPTADAVPGIYYATASQHGVVSNRVAFEVGKLPECLEREPNNDASHAQAVKLPIVINGRVNRPGDCDVFQFSGTAGQTIVAEVTARRLGSPLDSFLTLTDASGNVLAVNDDYETPEFCENTHPADSYLRVKLPRNGVYRIELRDVAKHGGDEYAYRLRISEPQPDFELYVVPSSVAMRAKAGGAVSVYAVRKDGFDGAIKLHLKDAPASLTSSTVTMSLKQVTTRFVVQAKGRDTGHPLDVEIEGDAIVGKQTIRHVAIPAEDRMEAFLWRHLEPADELAVTVIDPAYKPARKRANQKVEALLHSVELAAAKPEPVVKPATKSATGSSNAVATKSATDKTSPTTKSGTAAATADKKPKFTKKQVLWRLREIQMLYDDGLITEAFFERKAAECETDM